MLWMYIALMNVLGIWLMWLDKRRAKRHQWRIPERSLHLVAWLGGGVGMLVARRVYRHKSRKRQFGLSFTCASLVWLGVLIIVLTSS